MRFPQPLVVAEAARPCLMTSALGRSDIDLARTTAFRQSADWCSSDGGARECPAACHHRFATTGCRLMASRRNAAASLRSSMSPLRQLPPHLPKAIAASEINWEAWSRQIESKRRRLGKLEPAAQLFSSRQSLAEATFISFCLEGLDVSEAQVTSALAIGRERRAVRSRQDQRIRNHVAILREIDAQLAAGQPIRPESIVRWYASISSGLCPADLADAAMGRLIDHVHRINFPELRLAGAVQEIARIHVGLLADPLMPGFNGILCRLLLRYQLGRCALPPVFFHPNTPPAAFLAIPTLLPILMEEIERSLDLLLADA